MTQKEINKRHYYNRKNNGLCPRCGKPLDREGHYCSECLEKVRKYRIENRKFFVENNICTVCGKEKVPNGERICPECRAKNAERKHITDEQRARYNKNVRKKQNLLYKQRSEMGICTRCGKRKAMFGKKKCGICLQKDADIHRKKYLNKPNIKEYRKENHLCYFCGEPIDTTEKNICSSCQDKFKKLSKGRSNANEYWRKDNRIVFGGKLNGSKSNNYITVSQFTHDDKPTDVGMYVD